MSKARAICAESSDSQTFQAAHHHLFAKFPAEKLVDEIVNKLIAISTLDPVKRRRPLPIEKIRRDGKMQFSNLNKNFISYVIQDRWIFKFY